MVAGIVVAVVASVAGPGGGRAESPSSPAPADTRLELAEPEGPGTGLQLTAIADVDLAVALTHRPDSGDLYVADREGRVLRIERRAIDDRTVPVLGPEPVLDITAEVAEPQGEEGLLDIGFTPTGDHLVVSFIDRSGTSRLRQYAVVDGEVDGDRHWEILRVEHPGPDIHRGGGFEFGPDGHLYYGIGDGGYVASAPTFRRSLERPQELDDLHGKVLRITPRAGRGGYDVPPDNPFVGRPGARSEVWIYGARNPWRISFDAANGDLWIADVGNLTNEEVDHLPAPERGRGANLGYGVMEGTTPVIPRIPEPADHVPPVFEYSHDGGACAIIGGGVYRGSWNPELEGVYLYTDFCRPELRGLVVTDGAVEEVVLDLALPGGAAPVAIDTGPGGEAYVLDHSGTVYRLDPVDP